MAKYQFLLFFLLIFMGISAQKKKNKEVSPPPKIEDFVRPVPKVEKTQKSAIEDMDAFRWKNEPETLTSFTPDDLVERVYDFNGMYRVRIISYYPLETISYKKPAKDDERVILLGHTIQYDDYDTIEIKGNKIYLSDKKDPKKEKITLEITKRGNKVIRIKEVKTGRVFLQSEYSPSLSI